MQQLLIIPFINNMILKYTCSSKNMFFTSKITSESTSQDVKINILCGNMPHIPHLTLTTSCELTHVGGTASPPHSLDQQASIFTYM